MQKLSLGIDDGYVVFVITYAEIIIADNNLLMIGAAMELQVSQQHNAPTTRELLPLCPNDMKVAEATGYASGSVITVDAPLYGAK